jgi:hypothetical protein
MRLSLPVVGLLVLAAFLLGVGLTVAVFNLTEQPADQPPRVARDDDSMHSHGGIQDRDGKAGQGPKVDEDSAKHETPANDKPSRVPEEPSTNKAAPEALPSWANMSIR